MAQKPRWWIAGGVCLFVLASIGRPSLARDLFVDSGQRLGSEASWGVALGDVDGDGDLDAVVANFDTAARVWLNGGAGRFMDSGLRLGTGRCESIALADLDGDGALDIVLGSWDLPVAVWWNDGAGSYARGALPSIAGRCLSVAAGDLTGDGLADMYVGAFGADVVLVNRGGRVFADSGQRLGGRETGGAALGDMDGDGDLDVVAAGWSEVGRVWANDGTGKLAARCTFDVSDLHVHGAALADAEGDGDLDVFFSVAGGACCRSVWLNDGTGLLAPLPADLGSDLQHGVAVADFDGDGFADVALAVGTAVISNPSRVWFGSSNGYRDAGVRVGDAFAAGVAAGDLDGDGDIDLFFSCLSLPEAGWDYRPAPNLVWINTTRD